MTAKRFTIPKGYRIIKDNITDECATFYDNDDGETFLKWLNELHEENIELHIQNDFLKDENQHMRDLVNENKQLKKALLFFVDVANAECSSNWLEDMEKDCKRLFNCTYEEAKEKYGDYEW